MHHPERGDAARTAVYVDFDNVFSLLAQQDEAIAYAFAANPAAWLDWLRTANTDGTPRRFVTLRVYLNPGGSIETDPDGLFAADGLHPKAYYSRFRQMLVWAGFEVIDCPRLTRAKNGGDIRIVIDVLDALAGPVPPDEVVLMSSDSDFLPLLHRIRSLDRRSLIIAHPAIGKAIRASVEQVIGLDEFAVAALRWSPRPDHVDPSGNPVFQAPPGALPPTESDQPLLPRDDPAEVIALLREIVEQAGRMHLPVLGNRIAQRLGYSLRESRYAGHGSLAALLEAAGLRQEAGPGGGWVELG